MISKVETRIDMKNNMQMRISKLRNKEVVIMTITTQNINPILALIKGVDGSSLTIEQDTIKEALFKGVLTKLAERQGREGGNNIYYQVGRLKDNTILMHVKNNQYIVISRYIYCAALNRYIDVLPVLQQFSFCLGKTCTNRCHVLAPTSKKLREQGFSTSLYLARILTSLEKYGEFRNLKSTCDVHHKSDCWDNRQHMIMYVESSKHTHRNSHMTGRYVKNYNALIGMCMWLQESYVKFSTVTTIS